MTFAVWLKTGEVWYKLPRTFGCVVEDRRGLI